MGELIVRKRQVKPQTFGDSKNHQHGPSLPSSVQFDIVRTPSKPLVVLIYCFRVLSALLLLVHVGPPIFVRAAILGIACMRTSLTETFSVFRSFGVQLESQGRFCWQNRVRFIPEHDVVDIVINEVFVGFTIKYVLVIIVDGQSKLDVVFADSQPRLQVLQPIWQESRQCLYGSVNPSSY